MKSLNIFTLILLVFVISWIGVLPSLLISYDFNISPALKSLEILMTLGPILGACFYLFSTQGKKGIKTFFSRLLRFKTSFSLVLISVGLPIILSFLASVIGFNLSNTIWPEAFTPNAILSNGLMIFLMYLVLNTEELVWRGIVFDNFLEKYGYIKACLLLIPIWWLFHIPLFLYPGGHQAGYGLGEFTCIVIAQTFILGWIYLHTNRSLFYVHIHHQLINGFGQAFPVFPIFIAGNLMPVRIFCVLLLIVAGILILTEIKRKNQHVIKE